MAFGHLEYQAEQWHPGDPGLLLDEVGEVQHLQVVHRHVDRYLQGEPGVVPVAGVAQGVA
ncbi:hypothetical protein D3C78_1940630 [compost metagenome]